MIAIKNVAMMRKRPVWSNMSTARKRKNASTMITKIHTIKDDFFWMSRRKENARRIVNTYLITNTMLALMNVNARRNVTRDLRTN
jgi:hypothetical protein